jgi:catechol 2,3-dioxygenase-like lactoylglutathione lyase family enzyme
VRVSLRGVTTPGAETQLRIARPSRDLAAAERFWVHGMGLEVLYRVTDGHRLLMVGWTNASWHLELVEDRDIKPRPTEEDLLVLYLGQPAAEELLTRLRASGGQEVPARNPYWDDWGVTFEDPDGYRLVLSHRNW